VLSDAAAEAPELVWSRDGAGKLVPDLRKQPTTAASKGMPRPKGMKPLTPRGKRP
jgi:hypothetical protein